MQSNSAGAAQLFCGAHIYGHLFSDCFRYSLSENSYILISNSWLNESMVDIRIVERMRD